MKKCSRQYAYSMFKKAHNAGFKTLNQLPFKHFRVFH